MERAGEDPRHDSLVAAGYALAAGALELLAGGAGTSLALYADMAHNLGDSTGYGINAVTADTEHKVNHTWRKRAAVLVCAGALAVGVRSGQEVANPDAERPTPIVPVAAVAGAGLSYLAHQRTKHHKHLKGGFEDNARHAKYDLCFAPITIAATALASSGIPKIDSLGGVVVGGLTIWVNNPWKIH